MKSNARIRTNSFGIKFKVIPHKDCAQDAQSDFLSDETKNAVNTHRAQVLCVFTRLFVKYGEKYASRLRAEPSGVLCAVLP